MRKVGLLIAVLIAACSSDPPHKMIELAYFACDPTKSLEGGIYGKGPFMKLGPKPSCSSSEWRRLTRSEFRALGTEWHGKDWSQEIPFWSRP